MKFIMEFTSAFIVYMKKIGTIICVALATTGQYDKKKLNLPKSCQKYIFYVFFK